MTIRATNFAFSNFCQNALPCETAIDHIINGILLFASHMIELQHKRVGFTAINTTMSSEVINDLRYNFIFVIVTTLLDPCPVLNLVPVVPVILSDLLAITTL